MTGRNLYHYGRAQLNPEYLIVGSGLTGAVIARELSDAGKRVFVLERRNHIGGNVHDHHHPSGIRIHTYGPHYFRTNSDNLWAYVQRFADWCKYEAQVRSYVDGKYENWPVTKEYIDRHNLTHPPTHNPRPLNFEEAALSKMPHQVYQKFVKGYTEKQWGVPCTQLDASLAKRFDVREGSDTRFMQHKHQAIPALGYSDFMQSLLRGIPTLLNCGDYEYRNWSYLHLIYTGPIDTFFEYKYGKLKYRGQKRQHRFFEGATTILPTGQLNHSNDNTFIREIEWKHMMPFGNGITGTSITTETPFTPTEISRFEYPFPDETNALLYKRYRLHAITLEPGILICGRLGEYKYMDMDQAIARALHLADKILGRKSWASTTKSSDSPVHPEPAPPIS